MRKFFLVIGFSMVASASRGQGVGGAQGAGATRAAGGGEMVEHAHGAGQLILKVDTTMVYQTMENFAASDAWACQFVGAWPLEKREAIADLLFSREKGIGLSMWRVNLGAGSAEQGDGSGIKDPWRRAGDWAGARMDTGVKAQAWFVGAAHRRGLKQFLGFYNSPPVGLTQNGKAYAGVAGVCNIDASRYDAFAAHAVSAIRSVRRMTGVALDYCSPVNEPQWDWSDGGQEGCPYNNEQIAGVARAFSKAFVAAGVRTRILLPEAGHINYLLNDGDKPGKGGQARAFFSPGSPFYVGDLARVSRIAAAHSYFSTSPYAAGVKARRAVAAAADSLGGGLRYWQSEYCILGDNAGEINGAHRDTGMDAALYVAKVIHMDLVYGNAAAWQWWLAVSPYDYKDGLVYVDAGAKTFFPSRKLWALGNYSRFVRPGMRRVAVMAGDGHKEDGLATERDLLVSGFLGGRRMVIVLVNLSADEKAVDPDVKGTRTLYVTSEHEELRKKATGNTGRIVLQARSINTLVISL